MNISLKTVTFFLLTICLIAYSCSQDDDENAADLMNQIERIEAEIDVLIEVSTGQTSDDCRTRFIGGGNGCGPFYTYGIEGIDTVQLENLFQQLSRTKAALFNLQGGPVCTIIEPAKDSLINEQCKLCFENPDGTLDCF